MTMIHSLIIDTDPGQDDALAILLAVDHQLVDPLDDLLATDLVAQLGDGDGLAGAGERSISTLALMRNVPRPVS
jgi:hypothetical protein